MTVNEAGSSIWNISDIEGDSENWTLSSDVNMLNLLQTFSDNLLSNLNTSSRALEELITFSSVSGFIFCLFGRLSRHDLPCGK